MEKYLINYQKKEVEDKERNLIEYFERINNANNFDKDIRLTFMNC